ncbi:MAG: hypothetical protein U9N56_09110 [Actinomycetota bacterium]|nr:hypothetical protein [Actinomycetota bacterium]
MNRSRRLSGMLILVGVFIALLAVPGIAQEDEEAATTEAEVTSESDLTPAVPIPEEAEAEVVADWTYRYLVPVTLVLVVVVVVLTSIRYFTSVVRNRYRTVEE